MVFSSMLFLFVFLPLNLLSQLLLPSARAKNAAMLLFSLVFYGWAGPKYLLLLLAVVGICWFGALLLSTYRKQRPRRLILGITVALCLLTLGFFKYTGFFLENIQHIFGVPKVVPVIVLPIGISFYTFQLISYVVDVYRQEVPVQRNYFTLLLYASLFHQCIAGPIVRYQTVAQDIVARKTTRAEIGAGISRFTVGLAKKAILANGCAVVADSLLEGTAETLAALPAAGIILGVFAFSLQLYLDFSAYSDMAIGMGLMCGFHYKENFNYPYLADSITDFWRRWHISLSSFFRDYVYIPLGGNRCGTGRQLLNLAVVWFLTGMWHGASWNFILWGLFYGVLLCFERFVLKDHLYAIPRAIRRVFVLLLVMFGWALFKFTDLTQLCVAVKGMFGLNQNGFYSVSVGLTLKNNIFFLIFCVIAVTPLGKALHTMLQNLSRRGGGAFWVYSVWEVVCPVLLLILSAMALVGNSYNPFLYFQF